jgi:carbonic anhydrase
MRTPTRSFVIAFSLAALGASAGAGEAGHAPHWTYHGAEGPAHWGELAPEFATCKAGREQSPVDIVAGAPSAQSALGFAYTPQALQITNNGHTIQVDRAQGGTLSVGDARYALAQFHFHGPSEHTVTGKHYPLELHLVHKASDGTLAVVGVLIEQGAANPALAPIVAHLPIRKVNQRRWQPSPSTPRLCCRRSMPTRITAARSPRRHAARACSGSCSTLRSRPPRPRSRP